MDWTQRIRLGLRIDPKVFIRFSDYVHNLKQQARKDGTELPSQDSVAQDAIVQFLDSVEKKRK